MTHWNKEHKDDCLRAAEVAGATTSLREQDEEVALKVAVAINKFQSLQTKLFQSGEVKQAEEIANFLHRFDTGVITKEELLDRAVVDEDCIESEKQGNKERSQRKDEGIL